MIKIMQDGNIDMRALEISDIVDINLLQKFQDNFAIGMNCASVTVDRNGTPITKPSSYTHFCANYVHKSSIGDNRCANSHNRMGQKAASSGRPFVGPCHAGLIDFAAPVIINNELLGTVLGGQILSDKPIEETYRKIAQEIDTDEIGLINAVKEITVTDMSNINAAAEVLFIVVNSLVENGYARVKLEVVAKKLATKFMEIASAFQELAASAQIISQQQQALNQEIAQVGKITEEINEVLKFISQIATNTKLLGFNALIEAAHAGAAGRGFAVVANEIKILSDKSKETADNILELTAQIKNSVNSTTNHSQETLQTTEQQSAAMEEVSAAVQEVVSLADELNNMMKSVN